MRIIGGNDYYDRGMSLGHDTHITFVRNRNTFIMLNECIIGQDNVCFYIRSNKEKSQLFRYSSNQFRVKNNDLYTVRCISVIFCGKRYNGVHISNHIGANEIYIWSKDKFIEYLNEHDHYVNVSASRYLYETSRKTIDTYFGKHDLTSSEMNYIMENNITIMIHNGKIPLGKNQSGWNINSDGLKDIQFYKILDAYTAFQEIEMHIGGVLPRPGNPIVVITDDKVKAEKHGFDKFSFRKMKETT
jgi:hypothetical protein